jgi:hypothetical protein
MKVTPVDDTSSNMSNSVVDEQTFEAAATLVALTAALSYV